MPSSYYKSLEENAYCIGTRASAKAAGEVAPKVHGADKPLNPNIKPEHQGRRTNTTGFQHKIPLRAVQNASSTPSPNTTHTSIMSTIQGSANHKDAPGAVSSRKALAPSLVQPAPSGHIDRGFQPRTPIENPYAEYGTNFLFLGEVKNNLDRVTVVTSIPIPRFHDVMR